MNVFVSLFAIDYRCLIVFIICDFCYFFALLTHPFAAINTDSVKRFWWKGVATLPWSQRHFCIL